MARQSTPLQKGRRRRLLLLASVALVACDEPVLGWEPNLQLVVCGVEAAERVVALGGRSSVLGADEASLATLGLGAAENLGPVCSDASQLAPELPIDLVLVTGEVGTLVERLKAVGLPARVLAPESLNEVVQIHHDLGALLGEDTRARVLVAEMTREISAIATRRDGKPRKRVLWLLEEDAVPGQWVAVGATGILHELIELAGAENVFHAPAPPRIPVNAAAIAASGPDLVIMRAGASLPPGIDAAVRRVASSALPRLPILDPLPRVLELHELLYPSVQ